MSLPDLDQHAIDSLFSSGTDAKAPVPVNFAERRFLTAEQMKILTSLNLSFTRSANLLLSNWLQSDLTLSMVAAERLLFREQLDTHDPESMFLVEGRFHNGQPALIQIDLPCIDTLVHFGMGGPQHTTACAVSRELTLIDCEMMECFLSMILIESNQIWEGCDFQVAMDRRILPSDVMKVFPHSEYLLSFTYELKIGSAEGYIILSVPTAIADTFLRQISSKINKRQQKPEVRKLLESKLGTMTHTASLRLPAFKLSLADLSAIRPGTILKTGIPSTSAVEFQVADGPIWSAAANQCSGRVLASIVGRKAIPGVAAYSTCQS